MTEPHEPKDSDAFLVAQEDDFDSVGHVGALKHLIFLAHVVDKSEEVLDMYEQSCEQSCEEHLRKVSINPKSLGSMSWVQTQPVDILK